MDAELLPEYAGDIDHGDEVAIMWNPYSKVVQDHRDGTIIQPETDFERAKRGFQPFTPERAEIEVRQPPCY